MMAATEISLAEWQERTPDSGNGLKNRTLVGPEEREQAKRLARFKMLEVTELREGLRVRSFSYVGTVRFGDLTVQIVPKLAWRSLLNLLRYAFGFRRLSLLPEAAQQLARLGFADLLVAQLVGEAEELVARGMHRAYVPHSEWLAAPRGRIDVRRLTELGGVVTARLPCTHHPRVENTLLNRVLHGGLVMGGVATADLALRRAANRLATLFGEVLQPAPLSSERIDRAIASVNRLTAAYEPALTLTRLLHTSHGVVLGNDAARERVPGFLFDMNRFFQALLTRFLRDHLTDYEVRDEQSLRGVIQFIQGYRPGTQRAPKLRPDFFVLHGNRPVAVLDAKYRDLSQQKLPREMLYQLAMYAATQPVGVATILYPTTTASATEVRYAVCNPTSGQQVAQVNVRPVPLQELEGLLVAASDAIVVRRRKELARRLLLGPGHRSE
jgi:5-methylcytosine-specific restriction enzyme subunit McrC